jgi:hypothetical protein
MRQVFIWLMGVFAPVMVPGRHDAVKDTVPAKTIVWDQSTLKQVSEKGGNYARMVQLKDKSLLCVYESREGSVSTKSNDGGKTWSKPIVIAPSGNGINMAVPDVLELKDGSILASYNPRPHKVNGAWDEAKHFGICTKKSYDGGKTWKDERLIYEAANSFDDGCWEPSQIQLPSGEIQLFFSNEGIYTKSNEQNISIFRSKDNGLTWTKQPEIVSFRAGHRDGMPVPILLKGKNEIVFSIEDNAGATFKPSIIRNSITQNWQKTVDADDAERSYALTPKLPDTVYAGAPFLRQLHSGETILSYQSTLNRNHNWEQARMQVAVGDSEARDFVAVADPFTVPLDKQGLWNSICVLNDDTIIALTSTNAYGGGTAIWMIKGRLVTKK